MRRSAASYQVSSSQEARPDQGSAYLRWLEEQSMLFQADQQDETISGEASR